MANNTELITGHGEYNHISSFDVRAFNRAVFGTGKYIFTDAENMALDVDALGKLVFIKSGSCMWSGMHIRIENKETISFVSPATTDNVYLWLHYTRDVTSSVETIEIITTTLTMIDNSLVYDELPDDVTEAYTLFATFNFDAVNNVVKSSSSAFEIVKGMSDFYKETTQKLTSQAATNAETIAALSAEVNNTIQNFKSEMMNIVYGTSELASETLGTISSSKNISLSESVSNFKMLKIQIGQWQGLWIDGFIPESEYTSSDTFRMIAKIEVGDSEVKIIEVNFSFYGKETKTLRVRSNVTRFYRGSLGSFETSSSLNSGTISDTIQIYGIGRINTDESV